MQTTGKLTRLWEIDALRGFAIVEMVFYHFMWDLSHYGLIQVNMLDTPWQTFARSIATIFTLVMGVSLTLSHTKARQQAGHSALFGKYLRRGGLIFGLGMVVTVATYFFVGRGFVIFGILHMLGLSIILAYPFLGRSRWLSLLGSLVAVGLGLYLRRFVLSDPWFIWLGVKQSGRYMVDYYPLFPWFGVALLGIFAGYTLYPGGSRGFTLPDLVGMAPVRGLRFLGRHSLLIYLVHQPILQAILFAGLSFGLF